MTRHVLLSVVLATLTTPAAPAQDDDPPDEGVPAGAATEIAYADTLLGWRTYSEDAAARVQVLASADEDRPYTVVVDQLPDQPALVTDDARFVAETVARTFGYDPVFATVVFRFTAASFEADEDRALLLRATFRRSKSGALGSPSWRVISRDELADLTDRQLY
jgi:hypothetical protein